MSDPRHPAMADGDMLPQAVIVISQGIIDAYAAISGDFNPLHVDPAMAATTPFGTTIAHGCIPMEPIFKALQGWIGQPVLAPSTTMKLRYHRPSRPGDTISIEAKSVSQLPETEMQMRRVVFACHNQHGEVVIDGECELPSLADRQIT